MSEQNIFEQASRLSLRFSTPQGTLVVEDLWKLPLTSANPARANLDDIARACSQRVKESSTESFVTRPAKTDETAQLALDLVKRVIEVRLAENEAAATAKARKEERERLLAILSDKEDEQLKGSSVEDIKARIAALA